MSLKYFTVRSVKCKPEAPWLMRVNGSIQFTEELQDIICDVVSCTESEKGNSDNECEDYEKPRKYKSAVDIPFARRSNETAELFKGALNKRKDNQVS